MAKTVENDFYFDTNVSNIANPKIGVAPSPFDTAFEQGLYEADLTKPEGYETPEIKEATKPIDVAGGSKALEGSVDQNVLLFSEEEKEKERKKLGIAGDPFDIQTGLATRAGMSSDVVDLSAITGERRLSQSGGIGVLEDDPITPAREDLGQTEAEDLFEPAGDTVPQIGFKELDQGYDIGKKVYDQFTFESPTYSGSEAVTTSPSAAGQYLGAGVNLAKYTESFRTGLGTAATQGSIGLSSAPPASLAGQGTGVTTAAPTGSAIPSWGSALKTGTTLLQIYSIKQAFDSGTAEGKVSGSLQAAALINPTLAPFVAAYEGIKLLTGWGGIGKWFRGGGYKHPMGGVEFRLTSQAIMDKNKTETNKTGMPSDSDQTAWLNAGNPLFDEAAENDTLRLTAPYSWGYNGFPHPEVKKQAEKQIDYLYSFADRYGLDVNEQTFIKAATGSGGFQKHKPSGDRGVSVLERIDSIGNGSETANQWLREVFEYEGPNGEKIVSGTPRSQNINQQSGLYDGFATQEDFEADVEKFSQEFYS